MTARKPLGHLPQICGQFPKTIGTLFIDWWVTYLGGFYSEAYISRLHIGLIKGRAVTEIASSEGYCREAK